MTVLTADVTALAEALAPQLACDRPVICRRGHTPLCLELRTERAVPFAHALLASPAHAAIVQRARAEGWDEGYQRAGLDLGSGVGPADNPYQEVRQ